ncbi:hypothetical protein [Undibacterium baiyunense]|uniref:Uncharacterized protein n=1 Tax=Undibacterium baiyunense TaxID=2828731 RepID=A0A941DBM9_9BURK|nr:hypothetical protein [Undibacterium baiyunense]MBR7745709.1 hypothetical protein [Undibacterium baiyunense]
MKTTFTTKVIIATVSSFVVMGSVHGFQAKQSEAVKVNNLKTQQVTVSAKRMSPEEKLAFDLQSTGMQTVIISAKRLTAEQKLAMDAQDRAWQTASKSKANLKG